VKEGIDTRNGRRIFRVLVADEVGVDSSPVHTHTSSTHITSHEDTQDDEDEPGQKTLPLDRTLLRC
jgi:hypothetical protein